MSILRSIAPNGRGCMRSFALAALFVTVTTANSTAQAANSIGDVVNVIAEEIRDYALQKNNVEAGIYVAPISLPASFNSSGGQSIRVAFKAGLSPRN